ncbi:MAG: hypothetical protein ABJB86_14775, partial [Bacteroidota bacterium]
GNQPPRPQPLAFQQPQNMNLIISTDNPKDTLQNAPENNDGDNSDDSKFMFDKDSSRVPIESQAPVNDPKAGDTTKPGKNN